MVKAKRGWDEVSAWVAVGLIWASGLGMLIGIGVMWLQGGAC